MNPKKILFFHHAHGTSGADISLVCLMRGLERYDITCIVACTSDKAIPFFQCAGFKAVKCNASYFPHTTGGWYPFWRFSGLRYTAAWWFQYRTARSSISEIVKEVRPDIVHLNSITLAPYLSIFHSLSIPVVLHVRERIISGTIGIRKRLIQRLILRYASSVIYICNDNRDHLCLGHPNERVVHEPVDFDKFDKNMDRARIKENLGIPDDFRVVLFVGGCSSYIKGILPLLKSLRFLREQIACFKCITLGTLSSASTRFFPTLKRKCANLFGVYSVRQKIERLIRRHGLEEHVLLLPFLENVEEYYTAADVVAVPYITPHFARQILEAGAMAKPVVASKIGGIEEAVVDRETGLLVLPNDERSLANALAEVLENPEMGQRMGEQAYKIAKEKYELNVSVKQVMDIYASL